VGGGAIRLLLVDDHTIIRQALRLLLESSGKIDVVADVPNGRDAIRAVEVHRPDVVLMDISMPGLNGLDATRQIRRAAPATRVIILSGFVAEEQLLEALRAGASGYLLKNADPSELLLAVQTVHRGNRYFSDDVNGSFDVTSLTHAAATPGEAQGRLVLSPREREVLQLVAEGHTNQGIADELYLSVKTVESHKAKIMSKLGVRTRADLVIHAVQAGLILLDESRPNGSISDAG
jgi:two-component system response regulator NreC